MSDLNSKHNRFVWVDIPVTDLERSAAFYRTVLAIGVDVMEMEGFRFAVLHHQDGNGGCLVQVPRVESGDHGVLIYLNVDGRIKDAVSKVESSGGTILQATHSIGPHGFRAIIRDSEGNRVALHSHTDA